MPKRRLMRFDTVRCMNATTAFMHVTVVRMVDRHENYGGTRSLWLQKRCVSPHIPGYLASHIRRPWS